MKSVFFFLLSFSFLMNYGQESKFTESLYTSYETYKEQSLKKRRIKHHQLQPLLENLKSENDFTVNLVGQSIEGRDLSLVSIGTGETDIFLWSQMHGNEPTATQAIFDIFNFFKSDDFNVEKKEILKSVKIHFLPMLNPDGAERFKRRNALGVDINRDALRLQSPESQTLKRIRDSLAADFGFNLHDQSTYYNAERTDKPATLSYLAPAYNYEKDVNTSRANAMKVIVFMNNIIQQYAPGQVGRYNDDFEPRAFGDNIQKWGTSTILIESGGFANDIEKQEIRKLNYVSIISALYAISTGNYQNIPLDAYEKIPHNNRKLFDVKITNLTYELNNKTYLLDLGIHHFEVPIENSTDFWYSNRIMDQGDLSTYYGYNTFNAEGYQLVNGKVYPELFKDSNSLKNKGNSIISLLKSGYTHVRFENISKNQLFSPMPIHMVSKNYELKTYQLEVGANPTFLLQKNGVITHALINGFLIDLYKDEQTLLNNFRVAGKNAMIYR